MEDSTVARLLRTAELWALPPDGSEPELVAGWEDGAPFCVAVCATDIGLAFCRRCPTSVATRAIRAGRAASDRCPAGVTLLAFPAPRGARDRAAVLRVGPPTPRQAVAVADRIRISEMTLRRAARSAERPDAREILAAARVLRGSAPLHRWQVQQRDRAAGRRRTATAALAQMIATSEEFQLLYRASERQRKVLGRQRRRLDLFAREALRSNDIERARIAHQIHDTAAQSMVSAFRFLNAARSSAAQGRTDSVDPHLEAAEGRLQTAIDEVRAVLGSLLPAGLEELGVGRAVGTWLARLTAGTEISGEVVGDLPRLQAWVERSLYGMTAEAASNAFRHAGASKIRVEIGERRGRVVIIVRDDGRGFDPAAVVARRDGEGLGLLGMRRQASWIGGQATITSGASGGTVVRISIPLERHRAGVASAAGATIGVPHDGRSADRRGARQRITRAGEGT
jgi:signal transduction histidine kinase